VIEQQIGVTTYFAHPYHAWERGTNENTNGLIRDYFPKRTDFDTIPDEDIRLVEYLLNNRPRKRLGWRTPLEALSVALGG
jgi:IS30 family transposase